MRGKITVTAAVRYLLGGMFFLLLPSASWAADLKLPEQPHPALWRVTKGAHSAYLFGSMHILPAGYNWMPSEVEAAMKQADRFVFEVPTGEAALQEEKDFIVQHGILPPGASLKAALTPREYRLYSTVLKDAKFKQVEFDRYRPWLASLMVGVAYTYSGDVTMLRGADDDILDSALSREKPINYFESPSQQMELLNTGDDNAQLRGLKRQIFGLSRSRAHQQELFQLWAKGDAAQLSTTLDGYFVGRPESKEILIDKRNRAWFASVKDLLEATAGTVMVTVGAAHIGGDNGLIALFCGEDYRVERVGQPGSRNEAVCGPGV